MGTEARKELTSAFGRIKHCLDQLSDEQVWWRPSNSIGNLILHLCGNLQQWIVAGLGGAKDIRNRPAEFSERGPISKNELLHRLETVVNKAERVLARLTAKKLLQVLRIQGFIVAGIGAVFDSVPHFRGHTHEIIHITRCLLGDAYQFAWTPSTPEEGAP